MDKLSYNINEVIDLEDYYKQMYLELNRTISEVIEDLQKVQQRTEQLIQNDRDGEKPINSKSDHSWYIICKIQKRGSCSNRGKNPF